MKMYKEIDYDFEWNTLIEIASLDGCDLVAYFEDICLDIGACHFKEEQKRLRKVVRSELFLRVSN